jgi:hypothetical protein
VRRAARKLAVRHGGTSLAVLALAVALAALTTGCGSSSSKTAAQASGTSINEIVARLDRAGYQVNQDHPITHQIEDNAGRKFTPDAAFTISRPGTDIFVNLSISSSQGFMRAFRESGFRAVAIRGDRAYGLSSAGGGGSAQDLARVIVAAERG